MGPCLDVYPMAMARGARTEVIRLNPCVLLRREAILPPEWFKKLGRLISSSGARENGSFPFLSLPDANMKYWLMKTEPDVYSISDLAADKNQTTHWDGVRNYQARNFMRDEMKLGDRVLVYHSNANPPGVAGVAKVVKESYPDFTSWDPNDKHYDEKSSEESPRWFMVDIQLERQFADVISLSDLRELKGLEEMELLRKGSRLSVQPVRKKEFERIIKCADQRGL